MYKLHYTSSDNQWNDKYDKYSKEMCSYSFLFVRLCLVSMQVWTFCDSNNKSIERKTKASHSFFYTFFPKIFVSEQREQ